MSLSFFQCTSLSRPLRRTIFKEFVFSLLTLPLCQMARLMLRRRTRARLGQILLPELASIVMCFLSHGARLRLVEPAVAEASTIFSRLERVLPRKLTTLVMTFFLYNVHKSPVSRLSPPRTLAAAFDPLDGTLVVARVEENGTLVRFACDGTFIARHSFAQLTGYDYEQELPPNRFAIRHLAFAADGCLFTHVGLRAIFMATPRFSAHWYCDQLIVQARVMDIAVCENASLRGLAVLQSSASGAKVTMLSLDTGDRRDEFACVDGLSLAFDALNDTIGILAHRSYLHLYRTNGDFLRVVGRLAHTSLHDSELRHNALLYRAPLWYTCSDSGVHTYDERGLHIARVTSRGFVALDPKASGHMSLSYATAEARYLAEE